MNSIQEHVTPEPLACARLPWLLEGNTALPLSDSAIKLALSVSKKMPYIGSSATAPQPDAPRRYLMP
jgi:hypothetical protein